MQILLLIFVNCGQNKRDILLDVQTYMWSIIHNTLFRSIAKCIDDSQNNNYLSLCLCSYAHM